MPPFYFQAFREERRPDARSGREEVPRFNELKIPNLAALASVYIALQPCKCCIATRTGRRPTISRIRQLQPAHRDGREAGKRLHQRRLPLRRRMHDDHDIALQRLNENEAEILHFVRRNIAC